MILRVSVETGNHIQSAFHLFYLDNVIRNGEHEIMSFEVRYKKKVEKQINKLPRKMKQRLFALINDLQDMGPVRRNWPNYSELGKLKGGTVKHHCHLNPSWVACWTHTEKTTLIEVYYVGSRESAPY